VAIAHGDVERGRKISCNPFRDDTAAQPGLVVANRDHARIAEMVPARFAKQSFQADLLRDLAAASQIYRKMF